MEELGQFLSRTLQEQTASMSPWKPKHPCNEPGCKKLTSTSHCADHAITAHEPTAGRPSPSRRGYGRAHQRWRAAVLARDPLCIDCLAEHPPRTTAATEAHHVDGNNANIALENGAGLCKPHHSRRTAAGPTGFRKKPGGQL